MDRRRRRRVVLEYPTRAHNKTIFYSARRCSHIDYRHIIITYRPPTFFFFTSRSPYRTPKAAFVCKFRSTLAYVRARVAVLSHRRRRR